MYSESQVFNLKTEQSYCFLGDSINPSSRLSPFKNDAWNITIFHNDNEEIFRDPLMTGNSWSAFVMPGCRNIFHNLPNVTSSKHKLAPPTRHLNKPEGRVKNISTDTFESRVGFYDYIIAIYCSLSLSVLPWGLEKVNWLWKSDGSLDLPRHEERRRKIRWLEHLGVLVIPTTARVVALWESWIFLFQGARLWGLVCLVRFLAIPTLSQSPAFAISARFCSSWLTDSVWCWAQHWWTMGERA